MSPTIFREGPFRFYFFSREEERIHVHVQCPNGEAKFWLSPSVALAANMGMTERDVKTALHLVLTHEDDIRAAWLAHFGR